MYIVITNPGVRKSGPGYSHAQFPEETCNLEKNSMPFLAESRGVLGVERRGRPYWRISCSFSMINMIEYSLYPTPRNIYLK